MYAQKMAVLSLTYVQLTAFMLVSVSGQFRGTKISDMGSVSDHGRCEPITVPLCKDLQYNDTIMPNLLNHQKQEDAGLEVHQFFPLVKVQCSNYLKFFLCTVYVPICTVLDEAIPPCQSLCIQAKTGCENLMNRFGFQWPENLDCNKFPVSGLCVGENKTDTENPPALPPSMSGGRQTGGRKPVKNQPGSRVDISPNLSPENEAVECKNTANASFCPKPFSLKGSGYRVQIGNLAVEDCGIPCDRHNDVFGFDENERNIIRYWIGIWSSICIASTLFTVLTFVIDMQRFKYPERPIIFMSACYCVVAVAYLVGFFIRDTVACVSTKNLLPSEQQSIDDHQSSEFSRFVTQGTRIEGCTILFIMIYFFTMASAIWWVILALTWFLTAGLKWGHEAIDRNVQYFHLAAWAIPTIKTIAILLLSYVDGDSLSGVCFTGVSNKDAILAFIIAPLVAYLAIGTCFLLAGFVSLFRIRTIMKHDGTRTDKLEKLMVRIGIFSVLYTLPAVAIIACFVYEYLHHDDWMLHWHARGMRLPSATDTFEGISSVNCLNSASNSVSSAKMAKGVPEITFFLIKYLSFFVVGIVSGIWIWSSKTVRSWGNFCWRICCPFRNQSPGTAAV